MEIPGVHVHGAATNLWIVVSYLSCGFRRRQYVFYRFADLIERVTVFAAPIVLVGDINLHLDDSSASTTASFNDILCISDLTQRVTGATDRACQTLNVLITQNDAIV